MNRLLVHVEGETEEQAILEIGLDSIREQCPHFHQWIQCLESQAC